VSQTVTGAGADGERPVTLAAVAGAHGIGGSVRLKLFATLDGLRAHRVFHAGGRTLTVKSLREASGGAIASFAEVPDRTAAEALRGTVLTVPRAALPPLEPGEFYWHDLLGLPVETTKGVAVGTVVGVENFGASDLIEVERPEGGRFLVPLTPEAAPEVGEKVVIEAAWAEL
jgi:16S rRNA processing protein RimM